MHWLQALTAWSCSWRPLQLHLEWEEVVEKVLVVPVVVVVEWCKEKAGGGAGHGGTDASG